MPFSHSINKYEKILLLHAGHCHDTHTVNFSVTELQKVFTTMSDNSWNVALLISRSEFLTSLLVSYIKGVHMNSSQSVQELKELV
jgi:hypothetical protein